jgi:DNA-binding MarR family transcriptional regulator
MASGQQLSPVDGLAQLSFVVQGMLEHRAVEHNLSVIQARLLGVLRDRKPSMNELARLLGLDKSSVTGLVDRAERRGLVARMPSTTDRRVALVSLTDDGRALVSQAAACFETDVLTMLERLPARDRKALSRLVSRLLAAHAAEQGIDLFPAAAQLSWGVQLNLSRSWRRESIASFLNTFLRWYSTVFAVMNRRFAISWFV